jgi:hypothetical protein
MQDAADTLFGILPSLAPSDVGEIAWTMTKIIRDSDNEERRKIAQKVLIVFKNT